VTGREKKSVQTSNWFLATALTDQEHHKGVTCQTTGTGEALGQELQMEGNVRFQTDARQQPASTAALKGQSY